MLAPDTLADGRHSDDRGRATSAVDLLVVSSDDAFVQAMRKAVNDAPRLWAAASADQVSDVLLTAEVGVLILDVHALQEQAARFVVQIHRQFPDLVVLVAGTHTADPDIAKLVSSGVVYRFIHKPVSPARATLFIDGAVKKYHHRRQNPRAPEQLALFIAGRPRVLLGAGLVTLLLVLATIWGIKHRAAAPPELPSARPPDAWAPAEDLTPRPGELRERLFAKAENAVFAERLEEADAAIAAARAAGVEEGRLALLSAEVQNSRARRKEAAVPTRPADPSPLNRALRFAAHRIKEGRLTEPGRDSARFYVQEALRLDPQSQAAQAAREALATALLARARTDIDRRNFDRAGNSLQAAGGIASTASVQDTQQLLDKARAQPPGKPAGRLLSAFRERLGEGRLVAPANDSAKYYLTVLRGLDPGNAELSAATADLGVRLFAKARSALDAGQTDDARGWLNEANSLGLTSETAASSERELRAEIKRREFLADVADATHLTLVKSVTPVYPPRAQESRTEGWVELDFTVTENGNVTDIVIRAANPPGLFDSAASGALQKWRYRPAVRDGQAVAQRARIRIRFALAH
ncbi:MAG: hypothetical protein NVSMB10_16500 [Steroidobacteraceae bacterium]